MGAILIDNLAAAGVQAEIEHREVKPSQRKIEPLKIKDLPGKAQAIAANVLTESQKDAGEINALIEKGDQEKATFKLKKSDCDKATEGTRAISPDAKAMEDENLRAVQNEFEVLKGAFAKLSKGIDVPELRDQITQFFTEFQPEKYFTQDEITAFISPKDVAGRLKQAIARFSPSRKVAEMDFQKKMRKLLYDRGTNFLEKIKADCAKRGEPVPQMLSALEALPLTGEVNSMLDSFISATDQASNVVVPNAYYLGKLSEWIDENGNELERIMIYAGQDETPDYLVTPLIADAKTKTKDANTAASASLIKLQTLAGSYAGKLEEQEIQTIVDEIRKRTKSIINRANPFGEAGNMHGLDGAGITREFIDLYDLVDAKEKAFSKSVVEEQQEQVLDTEDALSIDYFRREVENLAHGQNLLLHAAGYEGMKQILRDGVLASRKAQAELYGKSNFNSSGIIVGKDYVELKGEKMTKEEYERNVLGKIGAKKTEQENHLISFSENRPYYYYNGIALAFSKVRLFSKSQFTEADGWQLFDANYDDSNPDSPGFSVDLTKEPMAFLVDEERRQDFEEFVRTDLSKHPKWQDVIKDPDIWLEEHVVYKPQMSAEDYRDNVLPKLREKMFTKNPDPEEVGTVIPTGEFGETVGGPSALFAYKLAA